MASLKTDLLILWPSLVILNLPRGDLTNAPISSAA